MGGGEWGEQKNENETWGYIHVIRLSPLRSAPLGDDVS